LRRAGRLVAAGALVGLWLHIPPALAAAFTRTVVIRNNEYRPAEKQIRAGDSIKWTNEDTPDQTPTPRTHTVTSDVGSAEVFDATLAPGESFTHPFAKSGTFAYHCKLVSMHGTIVVAAAPTTLPPPSTTRRTTTTHPPTTVAPAATSIATTTTDARVLDTTTTEETTTSTTTASEVAIKTSGGTNGVAVAFLLVAIAAVLGAGGYVLYRLRAGRF
jgi:plastocyanin